MSGTKTCLQRCEMMKSKLINCPHFYGKKGGEDSVYKYNTTTTENGLDNSTALWRSSPGRWSTPKPYENEGNLVYPRILCSVALNSFGKQKILKGAGWCMASLF